MEGLLRPGMRSYLIPLIAGPFLSISGFLPWVRVGDVALTGVPDTAAIWVVALGVVATLLAIASLVTRKNSRHPLLIVGLVALALMFLSWRLMPRAVAERALTRSQALAIVADAPFDAAPDAIVGIGIYLGLLSASAIVAFGLTIVVKRAATPYVVEADDDV